MVQLPKTNIIIDGFDKDHSKDFYVYFLTHMHSDHYKGLTGNW